MWKVWREKKKKRIKNPKEKKREREREIAASENGPGAEGGNARCWVPFSRTGLGLDWLLLLLVGGRW